jgi:hypothetical protein
MLLPVALVAPAGQNLHRLRQTLSVVPWKYSLREFCSVEALHDGLDKFPFRILVLRIPQFHLGFIESLKRARIRYPNVGLITIANAADPMARAHVKDLERHALIDERWEVKDFDGIIERMEQSERVFGRTHPRAARIGSALWIDNQTGSHSKVEFVDFAQMGAGCIFANGGADLGRGELHYQSSTQPETTHRIAAKIMRVAHSKNPVERLLRSQQQHVGIRFIAKI